MILTQKIQDTSFITENIINKDIKAPPIDVGYDDPAFETDLMAKLNSIEMKEKTTLQTGKDLGLNTPAQNEKLEQLKQKEKETNVIGSSVTATV